jgi:hypothetical protein
MYADNLPHIHVFHTHYNVVIMVQESTVEINNVLGMTAMHNLEFSDDTLAYFSFRFDVNDLGALHQR